MIPADVAPAEERQFQLLVRRSGADPHTFHLRKFERRDGCGYRMRVVGRGAATIYDGKRPGDWTAQFAADLTSGVFGHKGVPAPSPAIAEALAAAERVLAREGVPGLMKFLNARVPHRFTAAYRLDGDMLRNVAVADKHLHLEPLDLRTVPLHSSFCQFVLRDSVFVTCESASDERLKGHAYQGVMNAYVGVPIASRPGALEGTLCHFDLASHPIADDEFLLLERCAALLPAFLPA